MKHWIYILAACIMTGPYLSGQTLTPVRTVKGSTVTSQRDPSLKVSVPTRAKYLGAASWLLFGVADCEVHVFVEANDHKVVQRMYWIQFEGYTAQHPDLKYDYASNPLQKIDGLDFYTRARFGGASDPVKPGSDAEHVYEIIRAAGYTMPSDMRNIRLNYLPTADHRQEVMLIYAEDLEPEGVHWSDLLPGAKAADRWPKMQQDLFENMKQRVRFKH